MSSAHDWIIPGVAYLTVALVCILVNNKPKPIELQPLNPKTEATLDYYLSLENGWDGPASLAPSVENIQRAKHFLQSFPTVLSEFIPMVNWEGKIGLYCDNDIGYVDIEFEKEDKISIFTKIRSRMPKEAFHEINVRDITLKWLESNVGQVLQQK